LEIGKTGKKAAISDEGGGCYPVGSKGKRGGAPPLSEGPMPGQKKRIVGTNQKQKKDGKQFDREPRVGEKLLREGDLNWGGVGSRMKPMEKSVCCKSLGNMRKPYIG